MYVCVYMYIYIYIYAYKRERYTYQIHNGGVVLARAVAAQIASALKYLHTERFVAHGDTKPTGD